MALGCLERAYCEAPLIKRFQGGPDQAGGQEVG